MAFLASGQGDRDEEREADGQEAGEWAHRGAVSGGTGEYGVAEFRGHVGLVDQPFGEGAVVVE